MVHTIILRRAAYSILPLAVRSVGSQRFHHHFVALYSAVNHQLSQKLLPGSFTAFPRFYSSSKQPASDVTLLRVIESEIQCAQESDDHDRVEEGPDGFPFKIEDNPGQQTICLSREYQGESITVEVQMPDLVSGEDENDDDNDGEDTESGSQSHIPLVVRIAKTKGPCLEFCCTAYPDEIAIDSLSAKNSEISEEQIAYEGPDFTDLDENLQKSFHKYLEIRGIKPSATNFLHEYMINKDSREYLMWLKNLKKFIEA